jgi:hypothetical protein
MKKQEAIVELHIIKQEIKMDFYTIAALTASNYKNKILIAHLLRFLSFNQTLFANFS